jgi:hypothetical protein
LPYEFASTLRGSLSARPCARSELARILRAILRTFPPRARRATAHLGGILPQQQERTAATELVMDLNLNCEIQEFR